MTEAFLRRARTFGPALAVSLTLLSTTGAASAQCVDGTPFRPAPGGAPICTSPSAGVLDCDTDLAAGPVNVVAYAVLEPSSNRIEVFGNDSLGRPFCDQIPATGINDFRLRGSANPDVLSFYYTFGGARWDLAPGGIGLSASAYGRAGQDTLDGANTAIPGYDENLFGDAGNDTLLGNDGDDDLYGGAGVDDIYGGNGDDYARGDQNDDFIYGGAGDDALYGLDGNDSIVGEDGNDLVVGGPHDDLLYGDAGSDILIGNDGLDTLNGGLDDDILCGGLGVDQLFGNAGRDLLWGLTASGLGGGDLGSGGGGPDDCDPAGGYVSCLPTLVSAPPSCP